MIRGGNGGHAGGGGRGPSYGFGNLYGSNGYRGGNRYGASQLLYGRNDYGNYYNGFGNNYGGYGGYYGGYGNGLGLSIGLPLLRLLSGPYYSGFSGSGYGYGGGYPGYPAYSGYGSSYGPTYVPSTAPSTSYRVQTSNATLVPTSSDAATYQAQAEQAFREHRYEDAARNVDHAIVEDGQNGKLYLFASQVLFALGDYQASAAALQQGAGLLDRSEWGFIVQNYTRIYRGDDYVTQMARLVDFIDENPDTAFAHFLRGYHYVYLGHTDAARKQLTKAVELEPRDQLAAELLKSVGGTVPAAGKPDVLPTPDALPPVDTSAAAVR